MKKIFLVITIVFIGFCGVLKAQTEQLSTTNELKQAKGNPPAGTQTGTLLSVSPEQSASAQTERMMKDLSLRAEIKTKVYEINLKYAKKKEMLRQQVNTNVKPVTQEEALKISKERDADFKAILNTVEYDKYMKTYSAQKPTGGKVHVGCRAFTISACNMDTLKLFMRVTKMLTQGNNIIKTRLISSRANAGEHRQLGV